MKIFALYTNLLLTVKPKWLDEFRVQYNRPEDAHVTIKQPCFIEESQINNLVGEVEQFFYEERYGKVIPVVLDEVFVSTDKKGRTIMLRIKNPVKLRQLQNDLCFKLREYTRYVFPELEDYEKNFDPHMTIAEGLSEKEYKESMEYLKRGFYCEGRITQVVFAVVNDMSLEETKREDNKIIFRLEN